MINEGKRPIKAKVLVGVSVGCLMGCFRAPPPWRKTAPLKRPIKRSMSDKTLLNHTDSETLEKKGKSTGEKLEKNPVETAPLKKGMAAVLSASILDQNGPKRSKRGDP